MIGPVSYIFTELVCQFPQLLVFQKVCGSALEDSINNIQTFWSPTTKASDEEMEQTSLGLLKTIWKY